MKKYAIPVVVVLAVFAVTWSAFGQGEETAAQRMRRELREQAERYRDMSDEERAKFREEVRARGGGVRRGRYMNAEDQQKAIKAIEEQLVKLKAAAQVRFPQSSLQDLSDEERNKLRTTSADRSTALQAIVAQVALLQGRRQPEGEDAQFMIISTYDLKPIDEAATKETASKTRSLIHVLIRRITGRNPGWPQRPQSRPQGDRQDGGAPRRGKQ